MVLWERSGRVLTTIQSIPRCHFFGEALRSYFVITGVSRNANGAKSAIKL